MSTVNSKNYTCVLCDDFCTGYGNNASPLAEGLCCDDCNVQVIIARLSYYKVEEAKVDEPAEAKTEEPDAAEEEDEEEEEEEEEELAGDLCAGASDPYRVITYTMAGGGAHWWEYEVHYDDEGQQKRVYRNDTNGSRVLFNFQRGRVLFYYEDQPDQLRLEDTDFECDKWVLLEHYA